MALVQDPLKEPLLQSGETFLKDFPPAPSYYYYLLHRYYFLSFPPPPPAQSHPILLAGGAPVSSRGFENV